ncbi:MAG TPA: AI-2E family transporter [Falsiroseomonas sp.]|jgi:predicted PurR-regulated permease PerM|nr:AI-2E family transporter [Falsiroseomonas sp.]
MAQDPGLAAAPPQGTLRLVLQVALAAAGVFVLLFLAWRIREALLLAFAAVVVAVLLDAAARPVERWSGLSRTLALAVIATIVALVLLGFGWLLGSSIQSQLSDLASQLPQAINQLEQTLGIELLARDEGQQGALADISAAVRQLFGSLASLGSSIAGALTALVLVVVGGFFLAADPHLYRRGLVKLFPPRMHARVDDALGAGGRALRLWLIAELIAMAIIFVLVSLGAWAIGLPAPLALGLFAGLTEFVPIIGPIVGAIPGLLLALTQGGSTLLWAAVLYLAIQQLESNVITPLVQERMADIPPALLLFAVLAIGLVFGLAGVIIAAPLTVLLYVLVKKLYLRQTLGEATEVPGEDQHRASKAAE